MKRKLFVVLAVTLVFMLASFNVQAQETEKKADDTKAASEDETKADTPAKEDAQKDAPAKEEAKADAAPAKEEAAPVKEEAKPAAPAFPVDPNKIKVTVKLKNGKTITGVVKHFLVSENLVDHVGEIDWTLNDGPVVAHGMDEFSMPWKEIGKIEFNKKNKENGEISCYEVSDVSPERMECLMINEYTIIPKDKKKRDKEPYIVQSREMFRLVIDCGKSDKNVDSHFGKVKITNARNEERKTKEMAKELKDVYSSAVLWISFN